MLLSNPIERSPLTILNMILKQINSRVASINQAINGALATAFGANKYQTRPKEKFHEANESETFSLAI